MAVYPRQATVLLLSGQLNVIPKAPAFWTRDHMPTLAPLALPCGHTLLRFRLLRK